MVPRERHRFLKPTNPLPLHHSWPLFESSCRFDLGMLCDAEPGADSIVARGVGRWSCDLADNGLAWTGPVFDLFGLPHDAPISRDDIVSLYCEESRAAMERLRAYAIKHRRGFTVDMEIRTVGGSRRWMRLQAAPVCDDGGRVVRLEGLKQDVSRHYAQLSSLNLFRPRPPERTLAATRSAHPWR